MSLSELLRRIPPKRLGDLPFPKRLLGAFRRKSISFCTGVTDERTIVYWFQSKSFTIDLRLPDGMATPVTERQGWIGDTIWDEAAGQLSWHIERSYQPRNQWPEPATLHFIGNSVLEFAPSGAYVEDWRQQASTGPLLGLRLVSMVNTITGQETSLDGGLIIAGENVAYACSRRPSIDATMLGTDCLEEALLAGNVTEAEIESYEVSVAIGGRSVTYSTQFRRQGEMIGSGGFSIRPDGKVTEEKVVESDPCVLLYEVDVFEPDFTFENQTPSTSEALKWMEAEKDHLFRYAALVS